MESNISPTFVVSFFQKEHAFLIEFKKNLTELHVQFIKPSSLKVESQIQLHSPANMSEDL